MENVYWRRTVSTLIGSIWLYTLAGIAGGIVDVVSAAMNPLDILQYLQSLAEGRGSTPQVDATDILGYLCTLLLLAGYWLFYRSVARFVALQQCEADRLAAARIRAGYVWLVVAVVAGCVPLVGSLAEFVLMIVSYAKLIGGYRRLSRSAVLPSEAARGMARLRAATVWLLVAYIVGIIPLIGGLFETVVTLVTFFTILSGWAMVKHGAPRLLPEEEQALAARWDKPQNVPRILVAVSAYYVLHAAESFVFLEGAAMETAIVANVTWLFFFLWLFFDHRQHLPEMSRVGVLLMLVPMAAYAALDVAQVVSGEYPIADQEAEQALNMSLFLLSLAGIVLWLSPLRMPSMLKAVAIIPLVIYKVVYQVYMLFIRPQLLVELSYEEATQMFHVQQLVKLAFYVLLMVAVAWPALACRARLRKAASEG